MGAAFTQQLQQPNLSSSYIRTTAVTRHLGIYSGPEDRRRFGFNANVTERDLEEYFYPPFRALILFILPLAADVRSDFDVCISLSCVMGQRPALTEIKGTPRAQCAPTPPRMACRRAPRSC